MKNLLRAKSKPLEKGKVWEWAAFREHTFLRALSLARAPLLFEIMTDNRYDQKQKC